MDLAAVERGRAVADQRFPGRLQILEQALPPGGCCGPARLQGGVRWASVRAPTASVLARLPVVSVKRRTCQGLALASGNRALKMPASKPRW